VKKYPPEEKKKAEKERRETQIAGLGDHQNFAHRRQNGQAKEGKLLRQKINRAMGAKRGPIR